MLECRHCREFIRRETEAVGSRCPRCRMPLFERLQLPRRLDAAAPAQSCAGHPGIQAVGTCQRCGLLTCFTCRTRWHDQALCPRCVEQAIARKETAPEDAAGLRRQALLGLVLGLLGWVLFVLGGIPFLALQGGRPSPSLVLMGGLVILASFIPALFAVGQAASAIRARSQRLKLATSGLICAAGHLGIMIGFLLLNIWHN